MEDFYIKCNSKEESELCEKWAKENNLFLDKKFDYYKDAWDYFIVRDNTYRLNEDETYNLPEKTLADLGINNTTEKDWSKVSKEELLEEAKRRYPIGTKFKCLVTGGEYIIPENTTFQTEDSSSIFSYVNNDLYHQHFGAESNKWAEVIPTPEVKESISDSKFIVGKWYKIGNLSNTWINIVKIKKVISDIKIESEIGFRNIFGGDLVWENSYGIWNNISSYEELSIEEIQQYLPDGHPDKIPNKVEMKPNEKSEFKIGDYIYIIKANKDEYSEAKKEFNGDILKITSITKEKLQYVNSYWITHEGDSFSGGGFRMNGNGYIPNIHFRLATQEEIDSVTKPKESAKAWLRSKSKQSLPDYQAVHVDSQEKWDFVSDKLGYTNKWPITFKWNVFGSESCINLNVPNHGTKGIAYKNVISFEDWLDLTGYRSEWNVYIWEVSAKKYIFNKTLSISKSISQSNYPIITDPFAPIVELE